MSFKFVMTVDGVSSVAKQEMMDGECSKNIVYYNKVNFNGLNYRVNDFKLNFLITF